MDDTTEAAPAAGGTAPEGKVGVRLTIRPWETVFVDQDEARVLEAQGLIIHPPADGETAGAPGEEPRTAGARTRTRPPSTVAGATAKDGD